MISIIMNSYSPNKAQRHMDMECIAEIRKYTDGDYEIIIIDNDQTHRFRDDYGVLAPYTLIEQENTNVYESYHRGAQIAKGDIFVFIQNDVYVHEGCIDKLAVYLKEYDVAFPQQIPISREDVKKIYEVKDGELAHVGQRDAGLIMITREAYERCGGWDTRFHNMLGEKAFFIRWDQTGVSWVDRTNAFISHIMAGNNLRKEDAVYNEEMAHDAKLIEEFYGGRPG